MSTAQEYLELKTKHKDQLILYRIGEFYELFFDDAVQVAQELNLTLTNRGKHKGEDVPMCGIPAHARDTYLSRLLKQNKKIALYEQKHDDEADLYVRYLKQIYTPGTLVDEMLLEQNLNNFLVSIYKIDKKIGFAIVDLSTGEVIVQHVIVDQIESVLEHWSPTEILIDHSMDMHLLKIKWHFKITKVYMENDLVGFEKLLKDLYIKDAQLVKKILENLDAIEKLSMQALLRYVKMTQCMHAVYLKHPKCLTDKTYLYIHQAAKDALELMYSTSGRKESGLLALVNQTLTPMGSRKMVQRLNAPLIDINDINKRLGFLNHFVENRYQTESVREILCNVYDMERILVRIYTGQEKKMDYINVLLSLQSLLKAAKYLSREFLEQFASELVIIQEIESFLSDQISTDSSNILNLKTHGEYSRLQAEFRLITKGYEEVEERSQGEIGSAVKLRTVQGLDYILEIPLKLINRVPYHYKLVQTLSNCRRYTNDDLIGFNFRYKQCQFELSELEKHVLAKLSERLRGYKDAMTKVCEFAAELDIYMSFAHVSLEYEYTKPSMSLDKKLIIANAKHPVLFSLNRHFTPNNCELTEDCSSVVLTGPNMSGKSTYMKQLAQIIILAQMGCFVPADMACIGVVDAIYTRLGSSDDITDNKSTFMCEMSEMSYICEHATDKSFLIVDEIGRGTTPEEGEAIARAMLIYLHTQVRARLIFATHFHAIASVNNEMKITMDKSFDIQFKCMRTRNKDQLHIDYLYILDDGVSDCSYGLAVAKKANIPSEVINMAIKYLNEKKSM